MVPIAARASGCAAAVWMSVASCRAPAPASDATPPASHETAGDCVADPVRLPQAALQALVNRGKVTKYGGPPTAGWVDRIDVHPEDRDTIASLREDSLHWVNDAPDASCRDRRLVAFIGGHAMFGGIEAELREAATRLGPEDPAWSARPTAVVRVAEALPTTGDRAAFLRAIAARHPDPEVRAAVLIDEMRRAWNEGADDRVAELFAILSAPPYDATSFARSLRPYDPNHPLAGGRRLPEFSAPRLDGAGRIGPADLDGEINLLVLWGTHCPPCVEGMPKLHEIAASHPELRVVSVAWGDAPDEVHAFRERFPMPWTHGYLDDGDEARAIVDAFGWHHVPLYILVDREGEILAGPPRLELDGVLAHLER
jgi:thiol-disulfide isomerase/thioredoxin